MPFSQFGPYTLPSIFFSMHYNFPSNVIFSYNFIYRDFKNTLVNHIIRFTEICYLRWISSSIPLNSEYSILSEKKVTQNYNMHQNIDTSPRDAKSEASYVISTDRKQYGSFLRVVIREIECISGNSRAFPSLSTDKRESTFE